MRSFLGITVFFIFIGLSVAGASFRFGAAAQTSVEEAALPRWMRDVAAISDREVWAVSEKGFVLHTTDGGQNWSHQRIGSGVWLNAIAFLDARRGFIAGNDGKLFTTSDGGGSWQAVDTGTTHHLSDLFFIGDLGWVSGYWGTMLHTTDGGRTWQQQQLPGDDPLESVFFATKELGWAVGWSHTILHTADGGRTWRRQTTPSGVPSLSAIHFLDERRGWAVGMFGVILRTLDGGHTWQRQESSVDAALNDILFLQNGRGLIAGHRVLLASDDQGQTWRQIRFDPGGSLEALSAAQNRIWGAGIGLLADSVDGGKTWTVQEVNAAGQDLEISFARKITAVK